MTVNLKPHLICEKYFAYRKIGIPISNVQIQPLTHNILANLSITKIFNICLTMDRKIF